MTTTFIDLGEYNRRVDLGHADIDTPAERQAMAVAQWQFNVRQREEALEAGGIPVRGGGWLLIADDDLRRKVVRTIYADQ